MKELIDNEIKFVVTSPVAATGPGHIAFKKLASQCPEFLRKKWNTTEGYKFEFFEVLQSGSEEEKCQLD